jgi:hypothetical protein
MEPLVDQLDAEYRHVADRLTELVAEATGQQAGVRSQR